MASKPLRRFTPIQRRKIEEWAYVRTRLPPPLHQRLLAVAEREGVALEYIARKMIESCLPGWEEAPPPPAEAAR